MWLSILKQIVWENRMASTYWYPDSSWVFWLIMQNILFVLYISVTLFPYAPSEAVKICNFQTEFARFDLYTFWYGNISKRRKGYDLDVSPFSCNSDIFYIMASGYWYSLIIQYKSDHNMLKSIICPMSLYFLRPVLSLNSLGSLLQSFHCIFSPLSFLFFYNLLSVL